MFSLLKDMFQGGPIGIFLGSLLVGIAGFLVVCAGYGIFHASNHWGTEDLKSVGRLVDKNYIAPHYTTYYITVNDVLVPQQQYHEAQHILYIKIGNATDSFNVTSNYYDSAFIGNYYDCVYQKGRFTDDVYISAIKLANK